MNKMLVAVFENEAKAYEGLTTLKSLHRNGDITLYASAVISKDDHGKMSVKNVTDEGPVGTATGLVAGSMLGLLGGPVGLAIGAMTGSFIGLLFDADHEDVNVEFVDEVSKTLTNGKTAVVAEVDEDWTIPVDSGLEPLNAVVFRRFRFEVVDQQLERESQAIAAEFNALKEELKQANAERKEKINAAITRLKNKAEATNAALNKKMDDARKEFEGKVHTLEQQMKDANEKRKAKLQKRIDNLKAEYKVRSAKLKQAASLVHEALSPEVEVKHEATSI